MYKVHVRRTIWIAVFGLLAGLAIYVFSPKVYEGRIEMLLGTGADTRRSANIVYDEEVLDILRRNTPQGLQTERQLLNSENVFYTALGSAAPNLLPEWEKYYRMYDVITARTPNQNEQSAGVAQVRVRAHSPEVAKKVAAAIAVSYNETRRMATAESVNDAINYIQTQIDATNKDLLNAEGEYQKYKEEVNVSSIDRAMIVETDFRASIVSSLNSAKAELEGVDASIGTMTELIAKMPVDTADSSSTVRNPNIDRIEAQISELENQRAQLLALYTEKNPKVKAVDDALADAKQRLIEAKRNPMSPGYKTDRKDPERAQLEGQLVLAKAKRSDLVNRIASYESALDEQDAVMAASPAKEVKIAQLQRDRVIFDDKYRRLKTQLEELQNRRETGPRAAVVLGAGAMSSDDPVAPDLMKLLFIGTIAGACIGLVFSFSLESLRPRVYTSSQLADLTGLAVVASLPAGGGVSRSKSIEALSQAGAPVLESFRNMAYTYLATANGGSKCVLFTGIGSSGSSSIGAAQFAVSLAGAGTKVILVDAERTRQIITNGFGANDKKGISNAFQEGSDPMNYVLGTKHENMHLLPIGTVADALISEAGIAKIKALLGALMSQAQAIVIAVAPTDILADAAAFASVVDEVCLSVSAKTNEYSTVPMAYEILDKAGSKTIKLILTDAGKAGEPFTAPGAITRAV